MNPEEFRELQAKRVVDGDLARPRVLPPRWIFAEKSDDGGVYNSHDGLRVIVSAAREDDGKRWLHVSCSRRKPVPKLPSWKDLRDVKDVFVGNRKAIQVFPVRSEYVNIHPNVLHLFACLDDDGLPDFTSGTGSL